MSQSFVIIANGPFLVEGIINEAIQGRIIIALDGAADKLLALNITPNIILGDFDSIHPKTQHYWGIINDFSTMQEYASAYIGHHGVTIVPAKDQSETDMVKAIRYCDTQHATDITIICASYGREDHHEANKQALHTEYKTHRPIVLHSEVQSLRWARNETLALLGKVGDYCGFMAIAPGHCHSTGLLYPCDHTDVSLCNTLTAPTATIEVTGDALLFMPPQLATQRSFMALNEAQRLKKQWIEAEKVEQFLTSF